MESTMTLHELTDEGGRFRRPGDESAFRSLQRILDNPESVRRMQDAEAIHDSPALAGIVQEIEADPQIAEILAPKDSAAIAFRQLVGYQVLIAMERNGWRKRDHSKGRLRQSQYFTLSQRYTRVQANTASTASA
jgi:hypothetical protein